MVPQIRLLMRLSYYLVSFSFDSTIWWSVGLSWEESVRRRRESGGWCVGGVRLTDWLARMSASMRLSRQGYINLQPNNIISEWAWVDQCADCHWFDARLDDDLSWSSSLASHPLAQWSCWLRARFASFVVESVNGRVIRAIVHAPVRVHCDDWPAA